jgi:tetratricopeptide (TPR) repeat protein
LPQPPAVDTAGREPEIAAAVEAARAKVRQQPRSGTAWGRLGLVLLAHDYEAEARVCLAEAQRLDPKDPRWTYLNGRLVEAADPEAALPLLRRAANVAGGESAPRLHLAETLLGLGHIDEAAAEFRRVLDDQPDNPRAHLGLGRVAYQQGDLDASLDHLCRAATAVPKLRATHALLAEIHQRRGDRPAEERELALLADSADDEWPDPYVAEMQAAQVGSDARVYRARQLLREGKRPEAVALLQKAVQTCPDAFRSQLMLGGLLLEQGDVAEAEPHLLAAWQVRQDSLEALGQMGLLRQRQENYREAADWYERVIELQPGHALAYFNLANCQEQLGDRSRAMESLRTALRCKPDFAWAHRVLGRLLAEAGEDAEAAEHLEDALRLDPRDAEAKALLERVRGRPLHRDNK